MSTATQISNTEEVLDKDEQWEDIDENTLIMEATECILKVLSKSNEYKRYQNTMNKMDREQHKKPKSSKLNSAIASERIESKRREIIKSSLKKYIKDNLEHFLEQIKTKPVLIDRLSEFIKEIDEKAVPIANNPQRTNIPGVYSYFTKIDSSNRQYIELMASKLNNFTQGFDGFQLYIIRPRFLEISPDFGSILEMFKNIAECYYNLAININKLQGGKKKSKSKSKLKSKSKSKSKKNMKIKKHIKTKRNKY
jgi:hypothetical protein